MESVWFCCFKPVERPRLRLFCFPYAGAGAAPYRLWPASLPAGVELVALQFPGRESRIREPLITRIPELIEALAREIRPLLDVPFAFFGHSMGALVAFELARALARAGAPSPLHLFVSARRAPHLSRPNAPIHTLPDRAFLSALQDRYAALPDALLADAELTALFVPVLRADVGLIETYVHTPAAPLACPITAFCGTQDLDAGSAEMAAWEQQTASSFDAHLLQGGHFFVNAQRDAVVRVVSEKLAAAMVAATDGEPGQPSRSRNLDPAV